MASPEKVRGFRQGLYQISSTAKERVGRIRRTDDGRTFMYCKAGAAALAAGKLNVAEALDSTWVNEAIVTAQAAGDQVLSLTITAAGAAIDENQFQGGYFQINDAIAEGTSYLIESNSAVLISGTAITVTLAEPLRVALTTASEFTLVSSPGWKVTESASTSLGRPVGIAPVAVTATYYFWNQIGGICPVLIDASQPAVGTLAGVSDVTAGSVKVLATLSYQPVGQMIVTGVSGEYQPIRLMLGY